MARRSQLEGRLMAILDSRVNRKAAGRASVILATLLAIAMVAPFAAVRAQDQPSPRPEADVNATFATLIYRGVVSIIDKQYPQAMEYFQRAKEADSGQAWRAEMWMAIVSERENNLTEAETHYRSTLAVEDAKSSNAATIMELYARLLKAQGRVEEAKSYSERAAEARLALAAQQPTSDAPHIGNGIAPPKPVFKPEPEYTDEARAAKYEGTVVLAVEINSEGIAQNIRVIRGLGFGLDQNAIDSVSKWRFQPATKDGVPVTVQANIEVNFRLL